MSAEIPQREHHDPRKESDRLLEKCAVFGVYTPTRQASPLVHMGLAALQHRGQDASGITASDGISVVSRKAAGLVSTVFSQEEDIQSLPGHVAIGHNRYATQGGLDGHTQPVTTERQLVSLAHNGNLPETKKLEAFLHERHIDTKNLNDSEMMQRVLEWDVAQGMSIEDAVKDVYPLFTGAFSLVVMTKDALIGVRDSHGIRPLSIGTMGDGEYALSSETFGLERVHATYLRDVKPGEMVVIDKEGLRTYQIEEGEEKLDIFEVVYFARPESILYGKRVNDMREAMGRKLAEETRYLWDQADMVFGVPNSSVPAAAGYAHASGIPYVPNALIKDAYAHRTFINPDQKTRVDGVRRKFSAMPEVLQGKRIIVTDDSIVRGTTLKELVAMLKDAGAEEVHIVISSPPVKYPDFYGIATPDQKDLTAAQKSEEQIRDDIGADSLHFLSIDGLFEAIGIPKEKFNTSCFTGEYPIDIGEHAKNIDFTV